MLYFSVNENGINVSLMGDDPTILVKTQKELLDAIEKLAKKADMTWEEITQTFMHSSTMNWPKDETDDPEILALVEWLMCGDD